MAKGSRDHKKVLAEAKVRFEHANNVDNDNRVKAREDARFVWVKGAQWPTESRKQRETDDRPCLEINQLPQFVKQVVNDQRQNRPGIKVSPASGDASVETAELLQGLVRHIEYDSNAEAAYDNAFEHAVTSGRGYWRVLTDYESPETFEQKILIKRIADPDSVFVDPDYQEPDGSDIKWAFVTETLNKKDFEALYPKCAPLSWEGTDGATRWYDGVDRVVVADYFRIVSKPRTLVQMSDGSTMWQDEFKEAVEAGALPPELTVLDERESDEPVVEWYKIAGGDQVLEQYDWAGKYIPVIICVGDEIVIEGKRVYQGLIRRAKDSQTLFNISRTAIAEHMAMSPKAPWIAEQGQIEDYETEWQNSNKKSYAVLPYKATALGGTLVGPPQRIPFAGVPQGLVEQANECRMDLRATIGIYDPSLGQKSNETSGRAIIARERQGDTATFHFVDNLARAIAHTGRLVVDLIPKIYDTQRLVRLMGEDGEESAAVVNEQVPAGTNPDGSAADAIARNDVSVGKYAATVSSGPSYATRRAEAAEFMMNAVQSYPPLMQIAGDVIMKTQDVAGAEELSKRLKLTLPPPILQAIQAEEQGQDPATAQLQQQMQMMQQQAEQAMQQLQQQGQALSQENEALKNQLKSRAIESQAAVSTAQIGAKVAEMKGEVDILKAIIDAITKGNAMAAQQAQASAPAAQSAVEMPA